MSCSQYTVIYSMLDIQFKSVTQVVMMSLSPNSVPSQAHTQKKIPAFPADRLLIQELQKSNETGFVFNFWRPPIKSLALLVPLSQRSSKFTDKIIKERTDYNLQISMPLAVINIATPLVLDEEHLAYHLFKCHLRSLWEHPCCRLSLQ